MGVKANKNSQEQQKYVKKENIFGCEEDGKKTKNKKGSEKSKTKEKKGQNCKTS